MFLLFDSSVTMTQFASNQMLLYETKKILFFKSLDMEMEDCSPLCSTLQPLFVLSLLFSGENGVFGWNFTNIFVVRPTVETA